MHEALRRIEQLGDSTSLDLRDLCLTALPPELADLTHLTELNLAGNYLVELPDWLCNLTELEKLSLFSNELTRLPPQMGDLTQLVKLGIDDNKLSRLPDSLARLTNLTGLWIGNNRLTSVPDWVGNLTELTSLNLNECGVTELPDWLARLTRLRTLRLETNQLTELPDWLPDLVNLDTLWLSANQFTEVSGAIRQMTGLVDLHLGDNQLDGLPGWLAELRGLRSLDINACQLDALPDWIGDLTDLTRLYASSNNLTELPEWLGRLTHLDILFLSNNQLTGLPDWLGNLTKITALGLVDCGLAELPDWLRNLTRLASLRLDDNALTELPTWLGDLTDLIVLSLHDNPLRALDDQLAKLTRLAFLNLSDCQLGSLPDWIGQLTGLQTLFLSGNELTELPGWIGNLTRLRWLDLGENRLTSLPNEIGRLTGLNRLFLHHNQLTELPASIGALTNLRALHVFGNRLRALPDEIIGMTQLASLRAGQNQLTKFPNGFGQLSGLVELSLDNNQLRALPDSLAQLTNLTTLLLASNNLVELPNWLVEMPGLTDLSVAGNPFVSPPPEITAAGTEAVLAFLRARKAGSIRLWVSKLLVVGEGGVGKTSLVKALARRRHNPHEPSTHGLMISDLVLDHPYERHVGMSLHAWDFGGQQIYHATHQFFLTDRSLFVLLWNSRLGWEQGKLHYWLDIIKARAPDSPVVLVATHIHGRPVDLPIADLRQQYPMIVASVEVDSATGDGIDGLRTLLTDHAARLPLMGSEWPRSWQRAAIALRLTKADHISPDRMWQVMSRNRVPDSRQQRYIAKAMHELGDLLYYPDDPELDHIVVLRPAWVNDYISKVLDSPEVAERHGVLTRDHLNELWADLDHGVRQHFLGMMEKYDLSYRVEGTRSGDVSLVVERLQWNPPNYQAEWEALRRREDTREIRVIYRLNTMPPGIPTWFIARSHRFSRNVHWRTGALLAHPDGRHLALVSADRHRNAVELTVRGPTPAGFFSVLDDGLNVTLQRFPGLDITRQVPCPCEDSCPELYDYENLQARLARAVPRYDIECHRSGELVQIPQLLLGLAPSERSTQAAIDQLTDTVNRLGESMGQQSDYIQRMFLRLQRLAQSQVEARCPSVFAVVPADRRRIAGSAYEIHLYCEEPGAWHRLPEPAGVYPVTQPAEWFRKLGPYLRNLIIVLKHAAPLAGPVLGVAVGTLDQQLKADCDLMKELASQLQADLRYQQEVRGGAVPLPEAHADTDADFRALRAMLTKLDPEETWGGLSRTLTPEGLTLYLCRDHLAQYRQSG
ncbi:MAG TPA: COR domain-containing protein [Actinophytocola sp.]|uniref:leucine-rich repeat domain-containing protein n=1 Tax=Actinophytocola sp. TaxID=1872138 RepID=UPI002DB94B0E|nr:COR domain-containing protein [Actinophytocola sp.]HEU5473877.1 COR domain-containing protein [Actinophytocola sp.]